MFFERGKQVIDVLGSIIIFAAILGVAVVARHTVGKAAPGVSPPRTADHERCGEDCGSDGDDADEDAAIETDDDDEAATETDDETETETKTDDDDDDGYAGLIGGTPMVRLRGLSARTGCEVLAKVEFLTPGGTSKDRVARAILDEAEVRWRCPFETHTCPGRWLHGPTAVISESQSRGGGGGGVAAANCRD